MTTLNPSHNPFRASEGRHAQAVYQASSQPEEPSAGSASTSSRFPDNFVDELESVDDDVPARRGRREGRQRVRRAMPPMPDLRFEQSYLLSIRPFLKPHPSRAAAAEKGPAPADEKAQTSGGAVQGAEEDEVFHWGRQVDVDWRMVSWVTVRDQVISPLVQGALWGWAGIFLSATSMYLRSALYPSSHVSRGRVVGGSGGSTRAAGAGEAVGETDGWWRRWVKSFAGGVEAVTA